MKNTKNEKGITLIALIITIIIMLILVTVSITMAVKGGLFKYASDAGKQTNEAIQDEQKLATLDEGLSVDQLIAKFTSVHKWTREGDTVTCSHCNTSYNLGDPIPYTPDEVTSPYVLTAEKSGIKDAITNGGETIGSFDTELIKTNGDQEIYQEDVSWVVLGIEDEDGDGTYESLLITTEEPLGNNDDEKWVYFYGKDGVNNSVNELNNMCKKLYSSSKYGTARSMKVEDVNACLKFNPTATYYEGSEWKTTGNLTTKVKDLPEDVFEAIKARGTETPDGKALGEYVLNGYEYYRSGSGLHMNGYATDVPMSQTEESLIFFGNSVYWLASAGVRAYYDFVCFGPGVVTYNDFVYSCSGLFGSNGIGDYGIGGFRPVVSLRSDIPTEN